jgi:3-hydroxyacyl-CoA dehydrogenase
MQLLAEGITPQRIDAELEAWGMRMGPFRVMDLIGLDVLAAGRAGSIEDSDWALADRLVERGEFGRKSGAGWYRYPPGRRDIPNPEVAALLPEPREMDARDIIDRCVLALVDQGAAVLAEGVAERAGDIDVVYTTGYGFPRERGGPMFYADTVGIEQVVGTMRRFGWDPHPRLIERAMP